MLRHKLRRKKKIDIFGEWFAVSTTRAEARLEPRQYDTRD